VLHFIVEAPVLTRGTYGLERSLGKCKHFVNRPDFDGLKNLIYRGGFPLEESNASSNVTDN
jgi:hypothetical protein